MQQFYELGELIEKRWRRQNYDERQFPQVAADALTEADLPSHVDPWDIIRWVNTAISLPDQKDVDGRFGDPPITVFSGPRFYIDVYFWLDGTTSIHQHAFTGAFQVLLGSSIHSRYSFREDRILSEHFSVGQIQLEEVHLLQVKDVRQINSGRQYIHSLFHLDRPSVTITVRTDHTPSASPQFNYAKPYFAEDPFYRNVHTIKKLQTVSLLLGMKHKQADEIIGDLVTSSDFQTAYAVLARVSAYWTNSQMDELFGLSTGEDRFARLVEKARSVHGDLVDLTLAVFEEQKRLQQIVHRRQSITGEEHRFFLALLLNVPTGDKILELVKQRFPSVNPVEKVLDWVEELSQTKVLGSKESNVLGLEGFNEKHLSVLEFALEGLDEEAAFARMKTYPGEADISRQEITNLLAALRRSPVLGSLLANS
ncbi:MAG TPA: hypothetical protein VJV03_07085 [Pyrinomonadaceae bacterium]|nr:hypothetical protein [Pyrinomonadaceae bacterium]